MEDRGTTLNRRSLTNRRGTARGARVRRLLGEFIDGQECAILPAVCHTFDPVSLRDKACTRARSLARKIVVVLLHASRGGPQMYQTINYGLFGICGPRINLAVFMCRSSAEKAASGSPADEGASSRSRATKASISDKIEVYP